MGNYQKFFDLAKVQQPSEFEEFLKNILFDKKRREEFYRGMLGINNDVSVDTFREYFEMYAAERKTNQQDFTPDSISQICSIITQGDHSSGWTAYDPTAGTGALIIKKWWEDLIQETPLSYAPHRYLYRADELSDTALPFLLHNLAMRGMNCIVVHGDVLERTAKNIYFIQNSDDDYLHFSDVNIMQRTEEVKEYFGIVEWIGEGIKHLESEKVTLQWALPMQAKKLKVNENFSSAYSRKEKCNLLKLQDVAEIERVKKNKIYPAGTVVIQISATRGQVGVLESDGKVGEQYAAVRFKSFINPNFGFEFLKKNFPRYLKKIQEGLNIPIKEVGECPFAYPSQIHLLLKNGGKI